MKMVSIDEASTALGISKRRVRVLAAAGRIKGARKVGGSWVIVTRDGTVIVVPVDHGPQGTWEVTDD